MFHDSNNKKKKLADLLYKVVSLNTPGLVPARLLFLHQSLKSLVRATCVLASVMSAGGPPLIIRILFFYIAISQVWQIN